MLKIRLMRIGGRQRPFYRVVAVDERQKRTGAYIELLGTYNPLTHPHEINLKQDRIDYWIKQGAQMSTGFLRIIGKAPQRPPRKAKKAKKEEAPAQVAEQPAETPVEKTPAPAEELKTEEAPKEEVTPIETAPSEETKPETAAETISEQKEEKKDEGTT